MAWVKTADERRCGTCGVVVEQWVLLKGPGHQVAEATFCPVCYPDVKRVFDTPLADQTFRRLLGRSMVREGGLFYSDRC